MKNSPEIKAFIREHSSLFWYTPEDKKEEISEDLLVEMVLNYGDMKTIKRLISLLGIRKMSEIFFHSINLSPRRKGNYFDTTCNFFTLYFQRYAS
ncbi:MAG: hypothetical protein D4R67_02365 [Bacteroidetes bacterium]|nr:MAG: hypothetical protein D4R67_02365 [Bacteroidota bacterium]